MRKSCSGRSGTIWESKRRADKLERLVEPSDATHVAFSSSVSSWALAGATVMQPSRKVEEASAIGAAASWRSSIAGMTVGSGRSA